LASTLPTGAGDRFTGLPFTVTSLWRFHAGPGAEGIVTNLVRHINQEARPFEERTLIIAERDSSRREERFTLAYYDRSQGAEETVESRDVLEQRVRDLDQRYPDVVPRPAHWGGFRVTPRSIEFWQNRPDRLHDRQLYTRDPTGWSVVRLQP